MRGAEGAAGPFGDRLRQARLTARISQEELAERSGLSVRAISDLERGRTRHPYPRTIRLIVAALELPDADAKALLDPRIRDEPHSPVSAPNAPRQLPAGVRHFVGREREQQMLY